MFNQCNEEQFAEPMNLDMDCTMAVAHFSLKVLNKSSLIPIRKLQCNMLCRASMKLATAITTADWGAVAQIKTHSSDNAAAKHSIYTALTHNFT